MGEIRRNLMLGEWVIVTPQRAERPFQDPSIKCPFCPGQPETPGDWDVLTLENRYAALSPDAGYFGLDNELVVGVPAFGHCKVIITSREHDRQIENMTDRQVRLIFEEYLRVFRELDSQDHIKYVLEFENRGRAIGVSQDHPHSQVYAFPFVPPRITQEMEQSRRIWQQEDKCLLCDIIEKETRLGERVITECDDFVTLVPYAARLPYEAHIYPKRHVSSLNELEDSLQSLGLAVRDLVRRYSALFNETAYVMALHTRPSHQDVPFWHFHIEFYTPWRSRTRLKYLAGVELGGGVFTNDSSPEEKARELREAI